MPVRQVRKLKRGDQVILETGEAVVEAIHVSNAETVRIEWHGTNDARTEYHPGEILQVMGR